MKRCAMDRRQFLKGSVAGAALVAGSSTLGSLSAFAASDPYVKLDATAQAALVRSGEVSSKTLVSAAIRRVEALNDKVNAVVTPAFERALSASEAVETTGPFAGVPTLLKDLNDWKGVRTAYGSKMMMGNVSTSQTPYTDALENAGLIVLGKSNTPEFGLLGTTEPLSVGACHNPWNLDYSTGGSSGGSAAAVAAGMVPMAQASDGGGSIRIPASCCGVFGLKPTRGRMVMQSHNPMRGDISVKNVVSRSVRDSALGLSIGERTDNDALYAPIGMVEGASKKRLKVAFSTMNYMGVEAADDVKAAQENVAQMLEAAGHEIIPVKEPVDGHEFIEHFMAAWASGPDALVRDGEAATGMPIEESQILEPWTVGLAKWYRAKPKDTLDKALVYFKQVEAQVDAFLSNYDVWLSPVLRTTPPKLGEQAPTVPFDTLYARTIDYVSYTPLHNVAGTPAMSVPLSWSATGLPIGSQFSARKGGEKMLLELAYELEQLRPWADKWAPHSAAFL
jgi:amidase